MYICLNVFLFVAHCSYSDLNVSDLSCNIITIRSGFVNPALGPGYVGKNVTKMCIFASLATDSNVFQLF